MAGTSYCITAVKQRIIQLAGVGLIAPSPHDHSMGFAVYRARSSGQHLGFIPRAQWAEKLLIALQTKAPAQGLRKAMQGRGLGFQIPEVPEPEANPHKPNALSMYHEPHGQRGSFHCADNVYMLGVIATLPSTLHDENTRNNYNTSHPICFPCVRKP